VQMLRVTVLPLPVKSVSVKMHDARVTLKLQLAVPPHPSGAVQLTGVVPSPKTEPEGGVQTAVDPGEVPPVVTGVGNVTTVGAVAFRHVLAGQKRLLGTHGAAAHENVMPSY
jgi:hypothetical protein